MTDTVKRNTRTLAQSLLVLFALQAAQAALAGSEFMPGETLASTIDYSFVGHLERTDDEGRLLVWEATIDGDLQGTMKWWFVMPPPVADVEYTGGRVTFYAARWEIWSDEKLLLAGESAGKTNFRDGADGLWDGHGRVTVANGPYKSLKGRAIYETGPVIFGTEPPKTFSGTGLFLIY
jgi:hypothetical protein